MNSFLRSFWLGLIVAATLEWLSLFAAFRHTQAHLPVRPAFPINSTSYLSDYGFGESAAHFLFRFGFFGVGDRIRQSDVLLLGPSHVEFGLSAGQLAQELTAAEGRSVRVYNLGLGFGEGLPFDRDILAANRAGNKAAVIDIYSLWGDRVSSYGRKLDQMNDLGAFLQLANFWTRVTGDWLLDPWLPRILPRDGTDPPGPPIKLARMLGDVSQRRWDNGDVVEFWAPKLGLIFSQPSLGTIPPGDNTPRIVDLDVSPFCRQIIQENQLRPVFTMVPWGATLSTTPFPPVEPFVTIAPDGLSFFDTFHLTSASRAVATERLFDSIRSAGLLETWLAPQPK